ncbi:MAG: type II secretion system F family protein [Phycisphaerae bacterium]|nr:type II secretion system F family protein [Phycisphaerae bacterium]
MMLAAWSDTSRMIVTSAVMFLAVAAAVLVGCNPLLIHIRRKERQYDQILRHSLLMDISPRMVTVLTGAMMLFLGLVGYVVTAGTLPGTLLAAGVGLILPGLFIRYLRRRRQRKIEAQLVGGVQMLASGVRAGLNLVQSMEMIARDAPVPLREEFAHLLSEYEYGVPLDEAMESAARRVDLPDVRLLFAALQTHRQRGGDLGETLDRIAASIREIQRLESRVQTLTAQGRATARWLGAMPGVVMLILYFIDAAGVITLFTDGLGKMILALVVVLNIIGFLWIRKIMAIDI